uniref:AAA ATPase domain-containing protein n=1 Tax=Candidatus Kentrum sp. UNK TaxID=2126344 RepID=A0A451ABJ6_9GAMM|nr:MAG: hypothetical protein BECKUNK1418G_GA0071005_103313 [Candidatus Kentron sp. UNK]VFK71654.1 MAG: hypothetical protein BECKUNK1418H_GA0071006_107610 [Candidatus Kentron sp. UNK]
MTPMNTETNNAIAPRSAWEMIGSFAAIAMLGAAFHRIVPSLIFLSSVFLALSLLVGAYAFWLAVKERNKLPAIISTVATIAVACYLVRELWGCCPVPWLDATTAIIALAIVSVIATLVLWHWFSPPPDRPDWHLADAPRPLSRKRFVGRLEELGKLDEAWAGAVSGEIRTVGIIARGGFGKTTLVRYWLWWRFERRQRFPLFRHLLHPSSRQGTSSRQGSREPASRDGFNQPGARNGKNLPRVLLWHAFQEGQGEDGFVAALFRHLAPSTEDLPQDNARRVEALAEAIGGRAYLLILDGLEMAQTQAQTRSSDEGADQRYSPFLQKLLEAHEARMLGPGMVVFTSRLGRYSWNAPGSAAFQAALSSGPPERRQDAGADPERTLFLALEQDYPLDGHEARGVLQGAGVKIGKDTESAELADLLQLGGRHPLTLQLMGRFLVRENQGRIAGWRAVAGDAFEPPQADEAGGEGQAALWRVLAWTGRALDIRDRRVMQAIARFREPVKPEWLARLLAPEAARAVTHRDIQVPAYRRGELLLPGWAMSGQELHDALDGLVGLGFLQRAGETYAMHGLVREHFLRESEKDAPAIHERLYRLYASVIQPKWRPGGLEGLRPLYEAVHHGTRAARNGKALYRETFENVYIRRILRGTKEEEGGFYSVKKLGVFDADLKALIGFFQGDWGKPVPDLSAPDQAFLLNEAATNLRALGRLHAALAPMRTGLEMWVEQTESMIEQVQTYWKQAATAANNLSELELVLGRIAAAIRDAEASVAHAERSGEAFERLVTRATQADALHQAGEAEKARALFQEAEAIQAEFQPQTPRLSSVQGFQYCELLLAGAERAAWWAWGRVDKAEGRVHHVSAPLDSPASAPPGSQPLRSPRGVEGPLDDQKTVDALRLSTLRLIAECDTATERAETSLAIAEQNDWPLSIALDRLTLARAALYKTLLVAGSQRVAVEVPETDQQIMARAVEGLREAGDMTHLPLGLLTRSWLRAVVGDQPGAEADLAEAWAIAEGGPMPLFQADILLTRARLFFLRNPGQDPARARADLAEARRLIGQHGYHRRDGELANAEAWLGRVDKDGVWMMGRYSAISASCGGGEET